jgi:hypothetical protein
MQNLTGVSFPSTGGTGVSPRTLGSLQTRGALAAVTQVVAEGSGSRKLPFIIAPRSRL